LRFGAVAADPALGSRPLRRLSDASVSGGEALELR
jgi:hypothetical protein